MWMKPTYWYEGQRHLPCKPLSEWHIDTCIFISCSFLRKLLSTLQAWLVRARVSSGYDDFISKLYVWASVIYKKKGMTIIHRRNCSFTQLWVYSVSATCIMSNKSLQGSWRTWSNIVIFTCQTTSSEVSKLQALCISDMVEMPASL